MQKKLLIFQRSFYLGINSNETNKVFTRKQTAQYLNVTIDTLRNWEMNSLLTVKRKENGYRVYTEDDIQRLKIIRTLKKMPCFELFSFSNFTYD